MSRPSGRKARARSKHAPDVERSGNGEAQALLRGLAVLGTDRQRTLAATAAAELGARGAAEPAWSGQLGGVTLNTFELLTATSAADKVNLRDRWAGQREILQQNPVLEKVESTD